MSAGTPRWLWHLDMDACHASVGTHDALASLVEMASPEGVAGRTITLKDPLPAFRDPLPSTRPRLPASYSMTMGSAAVPATSMRPIIAAAP